MSAGDQLNINILRQFFTLINEILIFFFSLQENASVLLKVFMSWKKIKCEGRKNCWGLLNTKMPSLYQEIPELKSPLCKEKSITSLVYFYDLSVFATGHCQEQKSRLKNLWSYTASSFGWGNSCIRFQKVKG